MSFLNPILLFGLSAVAVPIIIHLLNRRRFQKVVWAAMRFLKVSVEQNQRRMRIEDLILLVLRCLLLILLALALARPAILSNATDLLGQSKVTGVVILDNSSSMGMSDGTQTRFDKAREAAEAVLDTMPAGSATAVMLASDIVRAVIPEPTFDFNLARKIIREAPLSDRATDLGPAVERAVDLLRGRSMALRREIFLITDGQASGWRQLPEIHSTLEKSRNLIKTHILLINEEEEGNLGVSGLRLASGLSPAKQLLRFEARVSNYGKQERRDIRVSLNVDGEPPCDEFTLNSLAPGATRSVSLFAKLSSVGYHSISARVGEDRLHADDQRTMAVRAIKEVKVLLVDGEPGSEPRDSEVFFLKHALVPVAPELVPEYFIQAAPVAATGLSQARLDDFDAVMLANVPDFTENTVQNLVQYVRRGGGLVVFPGNRVNVTFYNEQLLKRFQLLPAALSSVRGQADQDETFTALQAKDYEHPIVSIWNDPAAGTLAAARFFRWFELKPAASAPIPSRGTGAESVGDQAQEAGDPQIVLKFADGSPAVIERAWGLGRMVLFSSTADNAWNDLPVRAGLFVPLMHRLLGAVVQRQDEGLTIRVGDKFTRRVNLEYLDRDATFSKPRHTDVLRDLRRVEMLNGWPTLEYETTDFAGVYDVTVADPPLALKFAAQADPTESSLETLSDAQLKSLKEVSQLVSWTPNLPLKSLVEKGRSGLEFWLPIAILALVAAGLETFLGQWFSRSK